MEGDIEEGWHNGYDLTDSLESAKIGVKFGAQFAHLAAAYELRRLIKSEEGCMA